MVAGAFFSLLRAFLHTLSSSPQAGQFSHIHFPFFPRPPAMHLEDAGQTFLSGLAVWRQNRLVILLEVLVSGVVLLEFWRSFDF